MIKFSLDLYMNIKHIWGAVRSCDMGLFGKLKYCLKKEKGQKRSLVMRLFNLGFLPVFLVSLGMTIIFVSGATYLFEKNYEQQVSSYADIYSGTISQWTSLIKQQIEHQAMNESFVNPRISIEERKALLEEAAADTQFKDLSIAYADGTTYNDTDISERDYFKSAMAGDTYISSPVLRKTDGTLTIMVGTKVATGDFDGLIYGGLDVDFFSEFVENINLGETGMCFIVDSNGTIIAHKDEQIVLDQVNPIELANDDSSYKGWSRVVESMLEGKTETSKVVMPNGKQYLIGYCPIDGEEGWSVAVMVETSDVNKSAQILTNCGIALMIFIMIMEFFIVSSNATSIALPLKKATNSLVQIKNGNLSEKVEKSSVLKDETVILLNSLEDTRAQLESYIGEINTVLSGITEGDLDQTISRKYEGDFTGIKESLNKIIDSLNVTFRKASNASANLLEGARQVEMASQNLASASTEQASAVVEITASIEGIAKSTSENTKDVVKVNDLTQTAKTEADNGNEQMTKMIEAMNDISASSQNIAKIMKVIDDISFQTNILALNASVEAARAGVHGKGFAVVAEEVRSLAGKSSDAAAEIDEMIGDTIKKINAGSEIAADTAEELKKIVSDIDEIADIMENIATMSKEQATSVDQVNTGIEQISAAVQNNSATSEECAASSVELASQAEGLMKQIRYYRLK